MSCKATAAPDDLVAVGRIAGAYGVQGRVRIRPYSDSAEALLTAKEWWLARPAFCAVRASQARAYREEVLVRLSTIRSREEAEAAKGTEVYVSRRLFPETGEDEFYWVDLIGLQVINRQGEVLGVVHDLMDNGAHQLLKVDAGPAEKAGKRKERLIPFVRQFVGEVDIQAGNIVVDWESDF
ncbi:MAG: ribosome maturation factor RimM [Oxalobacter formigenes]|nr:ribosome maturation factor RimM [Oxalobacter formigenes]